MIPPPPRSTLDRPSAASDVYKRQGVRPALQDDRPRLRGEVQRFDIGALEITRRLRMRGEDHGLAVGKDLRPAMRRFLLRGIERGEGLRFATAPGHAEKAAAGAHVG